MGNLALPGWTAQMEDMSEVIPAPIQTFDAIEGYTDGGHLKLNTEGNELVFTTGDAASRPKVEASMKVRLVASDTRPSISDTDVHAAVYLQLGDPPDATADGLYAYTATGWQRLDRSGLGVPDTGDVLALKVSLDFDAKTVSYSGVIVTDDPYAPLADSAYTPLGTLDMANPGTAMLANALGSVGFKGTGGIDDLFVVEIAVPPSTANVTLQEFNGLNLETLETGTVDTADPAKSFTSALTVPANKVVTVVVCDDEGSTLATLTDVVDLFGNLEVGCDDYAFAAGTDYLIRVLYTDSGFSELVVEDDLYVTANSVVADPTAAITAVVASKAGVSANTVAPHVSFTRYLEPADAAVTLHYRTMPGGAWQTLPFSTATTNAETGVITYALLGNTIPVGTASGTQFELYATATYTNDEGPQSIPFANTEANPLRVDVLPSSPQFATHTNLVVAGAMEAPMDAATNGVWVGVLERQGYTPGAANAWRFDFGEGAAATSRSYGDDVSTIPFKGKRLINAKTFPAPTALERDVIFRYEEVGLSTRLGTALLGDVQTFENWSATQANGWSLSGTGAAVVEDASLALRGAFALRLAAGESLVLDKTAHPGVKEIGFWMRRDGSAAAAVTLLRHRAGAAAAETLKTFTALPTDRYVFCSYSIDAEHNPMDTDGVTITATAPVCIDGVYVSDCSSATLVGGLSFYPEPPLHLGDSLTVSAEIALEGGARFRDGDTKVVVTYGQGNSAAAATNTQNAVYDDDAGVWKATLASVVERADIDLYVYVTADVFDFGGDPIGTLTSETNCLATAPFSGYESLDIRRTVGGATDTTPMRLAADGFWKGTIAAPASAQSNAVFEFVDDLQTLYGGEDGANEIPASGMLEMDGRITAATVTSALAFEFDENEWTYNARPAKYAPLDGALPTGWTTTGTVTHSPTGATFAANATIVSSGNTGVGQVWFWAKRTTAQNVTYTIEYNVSATGNTGWSTAGVSGATGTIGSETVRFYGATVGNNNPKRIRIRFTGGAAFVQDVVATASGAFVAISNPKISTSGAAADAVASVTTNGPAVSYGARPAVWVDIAPQNGARAIEVNVEAVPVTIAGVPLEGAETAYVPMEGDPEDGGTFSVEMPALPAGLIGYRFVATYEGIDATQTTYPDGGKYYLYEIGADLEALRSPEFATLPHNDTSLSRIMVDDGQPIWQITRCYVDRFLTNSIAFQAEAGESVLFSRQAFNGIGRIYFKAHKLIETARSWVPHYLAVEVSDTGSLWETLNTIEIPYGVTEADDTQFCIEVNTYDAKYVRFVRTTSDENSACRLYLRDVIISPPAANVELSMPSIIHPGYPSQNDEITFRVDVASVYDAYPAVAPRPALHWRHYQGAVPGAWQVTDMASTDGEEFRCTLPAQAPGRMEYYVETHFSGAAYDYAASPKYDASMPLQFYYAYDDTVYDSDPKHGREGSSPSYLFAEDDSPAEFSIRTRQRALKAPNPGVDGDSVTPYLWFKVRAFASHHRELQFIYTNAMEVVAITTNEVDSTVYTNAPTWYTNSLQLVGDETWMATVPIPETVRLIGHLLGVEPYEGASTTRYGSRPTTWGDRAQAMINAPLASVASMGASTASVPPIEAYLGTEEPVLMMVRLDTTTGAYQVRRAAFQDFNEWSADPQFFEESTGQAITPSHEETFDDSAMFPATTMDGRQMTFTADGNGEGVVTRPAADNEFDTYYTSHGWRLRNGWILRERTPGEPYDYSDKNPNIAAMLTPQYGYLENTSGDSALSEGLDILSFRVRSSFGDDGHLPYYKGGFDWRNYTVMLNYVRVTQMSPAHSFIQVIAGYADEDNYVAMRLTQMREVDNPQVRYWVKQELVKVQNGVETILAARKAKNYATPSGNVTSNRFDNLELTGGAWYLSLSVTNNSIDGRAFPTWNRRQGTNVLYAANALTGTDSAEGGTISFDASDALVSFRSFYVREAGSPTNSPIWPEKWNLGGIQKGGNETRWSADMSGVFNKIPPLPFTIGVCKAGEASSFPDAGTYEPVYTGNAGSLAYANVSQPVHYWGNTFVRIAPGVSDARLVIDDIETTSWRGRALPESAPDDDDQWQAREAVVIERNGSRQLALTTSRANPNARQMVSTPAMTNGLGSISFNYEATGGRIVFAVERNALSGRYAENDNWVELTRRTVEAGETGEVFLPIRLAMSGKIRVRVLHEESGEDATLYLDNLFAKGFPPDDGRSWTAYNALIVAPTRNAATDPLQFEGDFSTQTAFLNNSTVIGTRPNNPLVERLPYIQTPMISTGVGEIGFWYRVWDPSMKGTDGETIPGQLSLWVAETADAGEQEWRQIPADDLSCITNGAYRYFTTEIHTKTNCVLRICGDTNGTQRVAIDNVVILEPMRGSPVGGDHTLTSPVPVPYSWFDERYPELLAGHSGDYEAAANAMASNGVNRVWQCYVAGISPLSETARFLATITMVEGEPVVEPDPDLNRNADTPEREYILLGAKSLDPDATWDVVTNGADLDAAGYRFFKVKVKLRE